MLTFASTAIRNCFVTNPEDPISYIQKYLADLGKKIEKSDTEKKMFAYKEYLFESNQVERTKVLLCITLSQLVEKFGILEVEEPISNEIKNESKETKKQTNTKALKNSKN